MRRAASWWMVVLAGAGALLAGLALCSDERQQSLERHEAAGLLREVEPGRVRAVELVVGGRRWQLARDATGWRSQPPLAAAGGDAMETALRLLRNAAPERAFDGPADAPEFGLDPPALQLTVAAQGDAATHTLAFGALNPIGLARYVRYAHGAERRTVLLPAYVADAWFAIAGVGP